MITIDDVRLPLLLTALDPLHHGAGTSGNTALLRTQRTVLPDGRGVATPFVSGNSIRHALRDVLAWHLVRTIGVEHGSLTPGQVASLWSGGALDAPGAKIDLDRGRRVAELLPHLTLMGYAAGNDIVTSTLRVGHAHLVCAENAWRAPDWLDGHPHLGLPVGRFRGEEFGTRHDPAGGPTDRLLAASGMFDAPTTSTQMIYDFQTIRAGSALWTTLDLEAATEAEADALACALAHAVRDGRMWLGARRAVGYGLCQVTWPTDDSGGLLDLVRVQRYTERMATRAAEIRELLAELGGGVR